MGNGKTLLNHRPSRWFSGHNKHPALSGVFCKYLMHLCHAEVLLLSISSALHFNKDEILSYNLSG